MTLTSFSAPLAEGGVQELTIGTVTGCPLNTPLAPATICTIPVSFSPKYPGKRDAPLIVQTTLPNGGFSFALVGMGVAPQVAMTPGTISTVAGNGTAQNAGDGGPATSASINSPRGLARDAAGNMYFGTNDARVKKIDPAGIITTFAGTGTRCSGQVSLCLKDNGPATSAGLISPYYVAVSGAGEVYISDEIFGSIRKVDVNGIITPVAGPHGSCFRTEACGDNGPAASALLTTPDGMAFDRAGNLYIADRGNDRIRKIDTGGIITTFAGTGIPGSTGDGGAAILATFDSPRDVALDNKGNLYIADQGNGRVRKVDASTGVITTVAGGGTSTIPPGGIAATQASINPAGLRTDAAGNVYIAETSANQIDRLDASGTIYIVAGGVGPGFNPTDTIATAAQLNGPVSVALDAAGNFYISDTANNRIREVTASTPPISFPDTAIGAASAPQTVGVSNIGNAELNFGGLATSPDFFVDSSGTCGGIPTLSVGNSCNLAIGFKPQQTGARTGTATVTDDALNIPGSTQTVQLNGNGLPAVTQIVLSLSTSSSIDASTPVKLTANVTPFSSGTVTTTGFISFFDNNIPLIAGSVAISATGEASITVPSFTVGTHNLTAAYGGDANFNACVSAEVPLTVTATPIALEVASSDNPSNYGQSVTFTATVPSGATGTVNFFDGATQIAGPVTIVGTRASFATNALAVGGHPITAKYSGDGTHATATSGTLEQLVNPAQLTVTVTSASRSYAEPNPTFAYTITGFVGSDTQAVVSGTPQITTTATTPSTVGSYPVTASLGTLAAGNYTFVFAPGTLMVTKATPGGDARTLGISVVCSPNPSVWGETVTCTAVLPANATGQVSFAEGAATLGVGTVVDERAAFTTTQLAVATHSITALYGGDINYNGASSPAVSQVVNKATLSVIANDQQRAFGQPNPPLTTVTSGLVNGDTSAVVTGAPVVMTTATATSPPGDISDHGHAGHACRGELHLRNGRRHTLCGRCRGNSGDHNISGIRSCEYFSDVYSDRVCWSHRHSPVLRWNHADRQSCTDLERHSYANHLDPGSKHAPNHCGLLRRCKLHHSQFAGVDADDHCTTSCRRLRDR